MKIIVTDRDSIQRGIVVKSTYVVISIADPRVPKAKITRVSALKDILFLHFSDSSPLAGRILPKNIKLMTRQHAVAIWKFVDQYKDQVGAIVVHCHQGMSRSPAIAAAIARYLGLDDKRFRTLLHPNEYIYQLMIDTMPSETSQPNLRHRLSAE